MVKDFMLSTVAFSWKWREAASWILDESGGREDAGCMDALLIVCFWCKCGIAKLVGKMKEISERRKHIHMEARLHNVLVLRKGREKCCTMGQHLLRSFHSLLLDASGLLSTYTIIRFILVGSSSAMINSTWVFTQ